MITPKEKKISRVYWRYLNEEKYYNTKKYKKQDKNNAKPN